MLRVSDCVCDCIRLAVQQPTEWQHLGNEIDAAMIFARPGITHSRPDIRYRPDRRNTHARLRVWA